MRVGKELVSAYSNELFLHPTGEVKIKVSKAVPVTDSGVP
jgi:hypothetical protein